MLLVKRLRSGNVQSPPQLEETACKIALPGFPTSLGCLLLASVASLRIFGDGFASPQSTALSLSAAVCFSLGCQFLERALESSQSSLSSDSNDEKRQGFAIESFESEKTAILACLRETAMYYTFVTTTASLLFESASTWTLDSPPIIALRVLFGVIESCAAAMVVSLLLRYPFSHHSLKP